jgi:hypothetical protein
MLGSMNLPAEAAPDHASDDGGSPGAEAARRRRLDEIFGDVLPEVTGDERRGADPDRDRWFQDNRPPHHG